MTIIECPRCHREVDIDDRTVKTQDYGTDLIVECPHCGQGFIVARVKHVRQKLQAAQYGYKQDEHGRMVRVKL